MSRSPKAGAIASCGIPLTGGRPEPLLTALPGYPARLSPCRPTAAGGWPCSLHATGSIEFVLGDEPRYRRAMLAEVRA